MKRRFPHTESILNALPVFEAAARHQSFTRAGEELGLSQPTVSHHIRGFERLIDTPLFARRHNQLRLTAAGERLAAASALGLGHIEREIAALRIIAGPGGVTLACSFSFANGWLMPRFSELRKALGDTTINLVTTDWLQGFDRDTADLIVIWAGEERTRHQRIALFPETVAPVCSPAFLAANPDLAEPDLVAGALARRILKKPLLHFDTRQSRFMTWEAWFRGHGIAYEPPPGRYLFSNYEFMLQAVAEGEGVGLGWEHLIEALFTSSRLVRVAPTTTGEDAAYLLEVRRGRVPDVLLDKAVAWFGAASG